MVQSQLKNEINVIKVKIQTHPYAQQRGIYTLYTVFILLSENKITEHGGKGRK